MPVRRYVVVPPMRGGLENLNEIAENLWFSWNGDARELFEHLDRDLWEEVYHNPRQILIRLSRDRLKELQDDEGYRAHAERVHKRFRDYVSRPQAYDFKLDEPVDFSAAYFSLEFGLTECLPIYSGGLGLLAGDHLKSASDLNVPLIGVGLFYHEGYFRQRLTSEGWQQETFPSLERDTLPLERQTDAQGTPLRVSVDLAGELCQARILKVRVGRVPLYLLDTDIPENPPHLRRLTARLYGGDAEMRIRQEILLGIGGCRALDVLGIQPSVFHLNEGHAAFVALERLRRFVTEDGLSLDEARQMVTCQGVLTVHTPVPAGNDVFDPWLVEKYFGAFIKQLGMSFDGLMALGRRKPSNTAEGFCMPVLGLRMSAHANGVSKLHGEVAREMWRDIWPYTDLDDVPIQGLTNGVHIPSYLSKEMTKLYEYYLGPGWTEDPDSEKVWEKVQTIPDTELWRSRERSRGRLVRFARRHLAQQLKARGASKKEQVNAERALDPDTLTICFARRFATYKRANLLFREPDRLAEILAHSTRPVQVILAGKAHPADDRGKELIRSIIRLTREEPFRKHVVFLEDYDINVARHMVQGADIWLNTPRRPLEACGTSGMKASANGALNLSILDGWWDEGYQGDNGWAIGWREQYPNPEQQDEIESHALYNLLEESVKPLFYERGIDDMPREWIKMVRRSIGSICPVFNAHRMVIDYADRFYAVAARNSAHLQADNYAKLKEMVDWKKRISRDWGRIKIESVRVTTDGDTFKGRQAGVEVTLYTAGHRPEELRVEIIHGPLDVWDTFKVRNVSRLEPVNQQEHGDMPVLFRGSIPLENVGLYGYMARVTPEHPHLAPLERLHLVLTG